MYEDVSAFIAQVKYYQCSCRKVMTEDCFFTFGLYWCLTYYKLLTFKLLYCKGYATYPGMSS